MAENDLVGINRIEANPTDSKSSSRKKLSKKKVQNISFFSFIRLLILPAQIELKDHSIRVKDPGAEVFSLKQKHEFTRVYSPSATDFIFFTKSLEQFTNSNFFILIVFGSLDIRRLFNYLNYNNYYIFDFDFEILGKLIQNIFDLSNEQAMPISDASSTTYLTPKIHYLIGKNRRNITIYIPEGYFSIIKTLKQMASDDHNLTVVLLSQISDINKDKYNSILSSLSLATKSLVTPKSKTNTDNISNNSLVDSLSNKVKKNISNNESINNSENSLNDINNYRPKITINNTNTSLSDELFLLNQNESGLNIKKNQYRPIEKSSNILLNKTPSLNEEHIKCTPNYIEINNNEKDDKETQLPTKCKENIKTVQKGSSQTNFLKQMMENTSSSPNELSGIFDTLGSIIKRSENSWKQTNSELTELQSQLSIKRTEQTKEAESLRVAEKNLEQLQAKLVEAKKKRIDLLNEKDKLNSYVTRSISITTRMKKQVRDVVERSSNYEKRIDEVMQEIITNIESETSEKIQSHELLTEMAILESEIENHLASV